MQVISLWNQGSSKAERQIQTIGNMINKHLSDKGVSWPLYASMSAYAMNAFFFFFFFLNFCWTKAQFVEPLIAPVLDFVCPSSQVSKPEWISRLHSFLLACGDP